MDRKGDAEKKRGGQEVVVEGGRVAKRVYLKSGQASVQSIRGLTKP